MARRSTSRPQQEDTTVPAPDNFKEMFGLFVVVVIAVAIIVTWLLR